MKPSERVVTQWLRRSCKRQNQKMSLVRILAQGQGAERNDLVIRPRHRAGI